MQTLIDGERVFCSFCGKTLIESFPTGVSYSRVQCPKWGTGFRLDFNHDRFIGAQQRKHVFNPITGERVS